ncbi:hypothetical protein MBLNU230_g0748t1 [Neophaeotheca triangularis]
MGSPLPNGTTPAPTAAAEPTTTTTTTPAAAAQPQQALPSQSQTTPLSSLQDEGTSKRPRDARLIHLVLSSLGIQSYQERVPLQLLDFAYRYSSGVLSDALRLSAEGYANAGGNERGGKRGGGGGGGAGGDAAAGSGEKITVTSLRQAIASRQGYSFEGGGLPKEALLEQAQVRNAVALPAVDKGAGGALQLPPEKDCLTGVGWGLKDMWSDDESMGDVEEGSRASAGARSGGLVNGGGMEDQKMGGMEGAEDEGDEEGEGRMEDVFGEEGEDNAMQD